MLPVLQVGSLAIPVPGLALLLGVWAALWLSEKEASRLQLDPDAIYTLVFIGLVAGLVGARLAYVLHYWSAYARDPLGILSLNATALAPAEGALIGVIAALVYGGRPRVRLVEGAGDRCARPGGAGGATGRAGARAGPAVSDARRGTVWR